MIRIIDEDLFDQIIHKYMPKLVADGARSNDISKHMYNELVAALQKKYAKCSETNNNFDLLAHKTLISDNYPNADSEIIFQDVMVRFSNVSGNFAINKIIRKLDKDLVPTWVIE
jgi:hypothetical protein